MIDFTFTADALPVVDLTSFPQLDDRAREWVHTLDLRGQKLSYLLHPDFVVGYQAGYESYAEFPISTVEEVIYEIELSLSRTNGTYHFYNLSYAWMVGSIFGYLTALLQADTTQTFLFLMAPVSAMHSRLARITGDAQ
jgi:hypothetical protein